MSHQIQKFYDIHADNYDILWHGDFAERWIIRPAILKALGNVRGKKVLDAGSGTGHYAKHFARQGAYVTVIDISPGMLRIAKEICKGVPVKFFQSDLLKMRPGRTRFDAILCIRVTGHIFDLTKLLRRFRVCIKKGGVLLITFKHPLRSEGKMVQINRRYGYFITNYFRTGRTISHWGKGIRAPVVYRPLSILISSLLKTGFLIDGLWEPKPVFAGKRADKKLYHKYCRIPSTLLIKARAV